MDKITDKVALVAGATGITGSNLAKELVRQGWKTYGLARRTENMPEGVIAIEADLLNFDGLFKALANIEPTHLFLTNWKRCDTEEENISVNSLMVRNMLEVLVSKKSLSHVGLVTGLKHYLGPFEAYVELGVIPTTPIREEHGRLDYPNFYYGQEDMVYAYAKKVGFTWSVHRPHTVIGNAVGNLMNMGTTIAVYASICKSKGQKMIWPGSEAQWNGLSDLTDAGILAKQIVWAASTEEAKNMAFNIVNGDLFRWSWLWGRIAAYFGVKSEGFKDEVRPMEKQLEGEDAVWRRLVQQHELVDYELSTLSSAWHTDLDLGRPIEVMVDMANSRRLGFSAFQNTEDSFYKLFDELRHAKIIP